MGIRNAKALILLVTIASIFAVGMANKTINNSATTTQPQGWNWGFNYTHWPFKHLNDTPSRKIVVGGSENWHFGFNYTDWAIKNGPFYLNDTLVFKYDPPNGTTFPHSVYLFRDYWSFLRCDLKRARRVAQVTQGSGEGFEFVLQRWQPHYFACGERDGFHCKVGLMKFFVMPLFRWHN